MTDLTGGDASACHYCGGPAQSRDHVVPRSRGGRNIAENIVPACLPCNQRKADRMPTCDCAICVEAVVSHCRYVLSQPFETRVVLTARLPYMPFMEEALASAYPGDGGERARQEGEAVDHHRGSEGGHPQGLTLA